MIEEVSVIIPAYNEGEEVRNTIENVKKVLQKTGLKSEIIVVDDGSQDDTSRVLETLDVKALKHSQNLGYGASLKTGLRHSKYPWIIIVDADGTYLPEDVERLLEIPDEYDMLVGARKKMDLFLLKKVVKWLINILASYISGYRIPDLNSGLRIFRADLVRKFLSYLPGGFSFTSTITLAFLCNGYNVKYIPIDYLKRKGKTKFRPIRDTQAMLSLIFRTILYFRPLKIFFPLSVFLFLAGLATLFYRIYHGSGFGTTSVVLLLSSIQVFTLGLFADLIDKRIGN